MRKISEILDEQGIAYLKGADSFAIKGAPLPERPCAISVIGLGSVGRTAALGLRLFGAGIFSAINISDLNDKEEIRCEAELNQVIFPGPDHVLPPVIRGGDIFASDILIFCASKGVPDPGKAVIDVRTAQYESNAALIRGLCAKCEEHGFDGHLFIVSDPVDLLCMTAVKAGFSAEKVRGFGLGVMNARALYYSADKERYRQRGRVFGPHGKGLVAAEDVYKYDGEASLKLTEKVLRANLDIRESGFRPYVGPAMSSAALSIVSLLKGEEHYSSVPLGSVFFGLRNRSQADETIVEDLPLAESLFERVKASYDSLMAEQVL